MTTECTVNVWSPKLVTPHQRKVKPTQSDDGKSQNLHEKLESEPGGGWMGGSGAVWGGSQPLRTCLNNRCSGCLMVFSSEIEVSCPLWTVVILFRVPCLCLMRAPHHGSSIDPCSARKISHRFWACRVPTEASKQTEQKANTMSGYGQRKPTDTGSQEQKRSVGHNSCWCYPV